MANTPRLNAPEISESQALKYLTHNSGLRILDAVVQPTAKDKDLTAPPGGESDGDVYIVGGSATGDWSGEDDNIAYYQSTGWIFITPLEGWSIYIQDEDVFYTYKSASDGWVKETVTLLELTDTPANYTSAGNKTLRVNNAADAIEFKDIPFEANGFINGLPATDEIFIHHPVVQAVNFPDDLSGSKAVCVTGPDDSAGVELSVRKNDVEFAVISFASAATTGTFTTASTDTTFAAGDILTVEGPNPQDVSFADVAVTIKGTIL